MEWSTVPIYNPLMSNRPEILSAAFAGWEYNTALNLWNYFSNRYHGLNEHHATSSGSPGWETIIDITGAGVLQAFWIAVKNTGGSSKNIGGKIIIDGGTKHSDNTYSCSGSSQNGLCLVGRVFWDSANTPGGCTMQDMFFESSLRLEVYVDDPSIDVYSLYKYFLTTV